MSDAEVTRDDFARYFPHAPTALCIKECARLSALRRYSLEGPLFDVGCGDGVFANIAFAGMDVTGIDINADEVALAIESGAYKKVILGDVTEEALPAGKFRSCVANCSLEHVPRIDLALRAIFEALEPGGTFLTFVPNKDWAEHLRSYQALSALGAPFLAKGLQKSIDEFFVHRHLHDEAGWRALVEEAGFVVDAVEPVLSSATTTAYELFLLPSLFGLVNKNLVKRWTNFPELRKLAAGPVYALTQAALAAGDRTPSAEFLVVARRPEAGP